MKTDTILVLAPHTDDGELGCGATLAKYIRGGSEVYYVAFSSCDQSLPHGVPAGTLRRELLDAMNTLGVNEDHVIILDYEVRDFSSKRQSILDDMIRIGREINPDLIFMPSIKDVHQDHYTIAIEGLRAFKTKSILCYEVPWNNFAFDNQAFSCVTEDDVRRKIEAVSCYKSQADRNYTTSEYMKALLVTHGVQVGVKYAEVFEIPRLIV